ncbi:hypothetical protein JJQ59_25695 [Cupriavidus necator]|uniref:hypothetical protein n=1 Tax=Cupriavidus necator TaxID=106590 RepID=UPI001676622E|nr:hypothetical protein [Cupriavidus necator]QQX88723.1 hypothetical protein JJQ59_25695 [Cupriavidus necator]
MTQSLSVMIASALVAWEGAIWRKWSAPDRGARAGTQADRRMRPDRGGGKCGAAWVGTPIPSKSGTAVITSTAMQITPQARLPQAANGVQQAWMRRPLRNDLPCAKVYMTFSVEMPVWR